MAYALTRSGRLDEARKSLDQLRGQSDDGYVPSYNALAIMASVIVTRHFIGSTTPSSAMTLDLSC